MATESDESAREPAFFSLSRGGESPEADPAPPPPLAGKVKDRKPDFLSRDSQGKRSRKSGALRGRKSRRFGGSHQRRVRLADYQEPSTGPTCPTCHIDG